LHLFLIFGFLFIEPNSQSLSLKLDLLQVTLGYGVSKLHCDWNELIGALDKVIDLHHSLLLNVDEGYVVAQCLHLRCGSAQSPRLLNSLVAVALLGLQVLGLAWRLFLCGLARVLPLHLRHRGTLLQVAELLVLNARQRRRLNRQTCTLKVRLLFSAASIGCRRHWIGLLDGGSKPPILLSWLKVTRLFYLLGLLLLRGYWTLCHFLALDVVDALCVALILRYVVDDSQLLLRFGWQVGQVSVHLGLACCNVLTVVLLDLWTHY
jgi:hypothetical protein